MSHCCKQRVVSFVFITAFFLHTFALHNHLVHAQEEDSLFLVSTITLRVTAVNPSDTKVQVVPIKVDLPQEVNARDIIDTGGLQLEYDSKRAIYYVYNDAVELQPRETRVFAIEIKDVWMVPEEHLDEHAERVQGYLDLLSKSESPRLAEAERIAERIAKRLEEVQKFQTDKAVSKETHIGIYRNNLKVLDEVKEDIARIERMIISVPGPPVPKPIEDLETPIAEAPSRATTWIVIFIIIVFIGLLAGIFFFTWHRQEQMTESLLTKSTDSAFKPDEGKGKEEGGQGE